MKLPKGEAENKVLDIFKQNPNKAYKYSAICEILKLKKSYVFCILNNLRKLEMIEKRGEYFCLKDKEELKQILKSDDFSLSDSEESKMLVEK
jgi:hydroxymethylpyrimidine pyrophosphatase-like HAD family hydrolase